MGCIPAPTCKKALRDASYRWPERNRASDGICGDEAHQARKSDHNLGNAFDLTHDVDHGVNCHVLANKVITDHRVKYVIWNKEIYKARQPEKGWQKYTGSNPHTKHMHVSIHAYARDDLSPWPWSLISITDEPDRPTLKRGDRSAAVQLLQTKLDIQADGKFGPKTEEAVKRYQAARNLPVTGIVDNSVWNALENE